MTESSSRHRARSHSVSAEATTAERQTNVLTFQIVMVLLLLCTVWATKALHLPAYQRMRDLGAMLAGGNATAATAAAGLRTIGDYLSDRLGVPLPSLPFLGDEDPLSLPGAGEDPAEGTRDVLLPRSSTSSALDAPPEDEAFSVAAMGGVSSSTLWAANGTPQRPRNVSFSPLLLSAKPRIPVSGTVTSRFGWRDNPLASGNADFHTGLDIAAAEGTLILASLPGVVEDTGYSDSYGNYIRIAHAGGLQTAYCHCSTIIAQTGESIRQGERIARVGSTGNVTGPHLHFEISQAGLASDPLSQLL